MNYDYPIQIWSRSPGWSLSHQPSSFTHICRTILASIFQIQASSTLGETSTFPTLLQDLFVSGITETISHHTAPAASALFAVPDHGRRVPAPKQSAGSCGSGGSRLPGGWSRAPSKWWSWCANEPHEVCHFCHAFVLLFWNDHERSLKLR